MTRNGKATETDSARLALDEPSPTPAGVQPLELHTPQVAALALAAFEHRADGLTKLAKKTEEEGYAKEARTILGDAGVLREHLIPQLRPQAELGLPTTAEVRAGVAEAFRSVVVHALTRERQAARDELDEKKGKRIGRSQPADLELLLGQLAVRVERFGRAVADRAYADGHAARDQTAEHAMLRSLDTLRAEGDPG